MDYKYTKLYRLIYEKASFDTLRKAEQIIALCQVRYCLEDDLIGNAIIIYTAWQKAYPEGIEYNEIPIRSQDIEAIPQSEFICLPWIYLNALETMCADKEEREDGEITTETVLKEKVDFSWCTINPRIANIHSFPHNYNNYMKSAWVKEFVEKMKIVWPLTSEANAANATDAETVLDSETEDELHQYIPLLPSSPQIIQYTPDISSSFELETPPLTFFDAIERADVQPPVPIVIELSLEQIKRKFVRAVEHYWPFMRCKNIYKAYHGTGRLSHYELLIWIARRFGVKEENLKNTDPYTITNIRIQGLPNRSRFKT